MNRRMIVFLLAACVAAAAAAHTGWVERIVAAYRDRTPIETDAGLAPEAAWRIQQRVVEALRADLGGIFGYKAGLTSPSARKRFNIDEPVMGTLLKGMILDNGARISVAGGVTLLIEADLLVRVADRRINDAATRAEAFAAIDRIAAFVEVPDIVIAPGQPVTGPVLTAVNAGARFGVMGPVLDVDEVRMGQLADFTVNVSRNGYPAGPIGTGKALMDHPLNVVLWIAGEARHRGVTLEAGDWLSLGSLTPPMRAVAGDGYRLRYEGLGSGGMEVVVEFIP